MAFMSGKLLAKIMDGLALGLMEIEEETEKYGFGASAAKRRFQG